MTVHEHMKKHLRRVPRGGIGWNRIVFTTAPAFAPEALLDAAVDMAWERLMPPSLERPSLEMTYLAASYEVSCRGTGRFPRQASGYATMKRIKKEGRLLVFRIKPLSLEQVLAEAA